MSMIVQTQKKVPALRFPGFDVEWKVKAMDQIVERVSEPVDVKSEKLYEQIGIRSHGKGIFYKDSVTGESLGKKRVFWVKSNVFIVNIVFAWEQAVAKTTENEAGMIASHRFPMYLPIKGVSDLNFILFLFLTNRGKYLLGLASPGGAGRNKTLGQGEFAQLKIKIPSFKEQQKIADFLTSIDTRIQQLTRKVALLEQYKKGVMQQIFSQAIRFQDDQGQDFLAWEEVKLSKVLHEHKRKSEGTEEVFSVSVHKGLINQIEHLGRSFAAKTTDHYNLVQPGDVVYTKSPTGDFPYGIIKQSRVDENVIVSPLYGVFTPETLALGYILNDYFNSSVNTHNYLYPIIQKGAKNTINITNKTFLSKSLKLPRSKREQQKIADFLSAIDRKITHTKDQLNHMQRFKKGLLQQLFV